MLVVGILEFKPFTEQRTLVHDGVIIYLITSTNHDMERPCLMTVEYISPQWIWSREIIRASGCQ